MTTANIEQSVLGLEKSYWDAIKKKDGAAAARLTADTCLVVSADGVRQVRRDEMPAMMKATPFELQDYGIEGGDVQFMHVGDDVAIVAYKVRANYENDGQSQQMDAYDASVWVKRDGEWTCALHTETPAASKPPDGKIA
jgi:uncharacterized protein (TIGR02246 family)